MRGSGRACPPGRLKTGGGHCVHLGCHGVTPWDVWLCSGLKFLMSLVSVGRARICHCTVQVASRWRRTRARERGLIAPPWGPALRRASPRSAAAGPDGPHRAQPLARRRSSVSSRRARSALREPAWPPRRRARSRRLPRSRRRAISSAGHVAHLSFCGPWPISSSPGTTRRTRSAVFTAYLQWMLRRCPS
jgi:hypothetical protein